MKNYKKLFSSYWGYYADDILMCWNCYKRVAVDIHHIEQKGMGGVANNRLNRIDNLFPLCRECHTKAHSNKYLNKKFKKILDYKIKIKELEIT